MGSRSIRAMICSSESPTLVIFTPMARLYGNGALIMSTPTEARGLACRNFVPRSEYDVSLESCNLAVEYNRPIATTKGAPHAIRVTLVALVAGTSCKK